jgi:hypothetical protein
MENTVMVPQNEYDTLVYQASAYRALASTFAGVQSDRTVADVVANFAKTKKYSSGFLNDLKEGLTDLRKSKAWKSK